KQEHGKEKNLKHLNGLTEQEMSSKAGPIVLQNNRDVVLNKVKLLITTQHGKKSCRPAAQQPANPSLHKLDLQPSTSISYKAVLGCLVTAKIRSQVL
ncbi:hypothetical protein THAOC_19394, partial [Thalassiosira oceanica]